MSVNPSTFMNAPVHSSIEPYVLRSNVPVQESFYLQFFDEIQNLRSQYQHYLIQLRGYGKNYDSKQMFNGIVQITCSYAQTHFRNYSQHFVLVYNVNERYVYLENVAQAAWNTPWKRILFPFNDPYVQMHMLECLRMWLRICFTVQFELRQQAFENYLSQNK
jgi:hypothetical protein